MESNLLATVDVHTSRLHGSLHCALHCALQCALHWAYSATRRVTGGGVLYVAVKQVGVLRYNASTAAALGVVLCNDCIGITYDR